MNTSVLGTPLGDSTLIGYILPEKKASRTEETAEDAEDSDADEEEDEKQPEFLDMSEMESVSSGGHMFRSSIPSRNEVEFQDFVSGKTCRVVGRFALTNPWWEVTCVARRQGNKLVVGGYPSYKLRSDLDREGWRAMVSLFLAACDIQPPELIKQFFDWLPEDRDITISNLMEILMEFEEGGYVGEAQCIRARVSDSAAGKQVHAVSLYPRVMEYLPTLLPGHFADLLVKGKMRERRSTTQTTQATQAVLSTQQEDEKDEEGGKEEEVDLSLLAKLEAIIRSDVWKLGFNHVMKKELKLVRCEAQLRAFIECDLLEEISPLQRNALWVYEQLKKYCYRTGSTYMNQQVLCENLSRDSVMPHEDVWEAVQFLRELGIVVRDKQKVALQNFHYYETGIAACLRCLVEGEPWKIPLNAREVLYEAAEERLRLKTQAAESEQVATQPVDLDGNPADVDPEGVSLPPAHGEKGTLIKSEPNVGPNCVSVPSSHGEKSTCMKSEPNFYSDSVSVPFAHVEKNILIKPEPREMGINRIKTEPNGDYEEPKHTSAASDSPHEVSGPGHTATDLDSKDENLPRMELDPDQVRVAEMICANPVTVISGKGGCGKTTVVSLLFKAAMHQHSRDREEIRKACLDFENDSGGSQGWLDPPLSPSFLSPLEGEVKEEGERKRALQGADEILLTAPTGRAASLLTKKTCLTAYTLHQVWWSFSSTKKNELGEPMDWKFKSVRVFVVDEGSLVCVQLLHSILDMLIKHAQLKKFIILGDVRQLPSIQPGNTLSDLFHSLKVAQWAIEMKTNHRAESELIVRNAGLIADMGKRHCYSPLDFDATVDLSGPYTMPSDDKKFILIRLPDEESYDDLQRAVNLLIDKAPGLQDDSTSQFIAFKRVDVALINGLCCKHYSNHLTKDHKNRLVFQLRDKVCCTKNGYILDEDEDMQKVLEKYKKGREERDSLLEADMTGDGGNKSEKKEAKVRLCNGEIFFIREDKTEVEDSGSARRRPRSNRFLTLDDCNGRMLRFDFRELRRECRLQHAWARTIHTFQGSENETIVYVLGNGSAQTWKHVYTAVTRGQKRVYVIAKEGGIASAINRRETPRNTRLGHLVREVLASGKPDNEGRDLLSQPDNSQSQPGMLRRTVPGFGPTQSSPVSSWTPGTSRATCLHSTTFLPKSLWKAKEVKEEETAGTSLEDDITFSQAYSWSPMNSSDDHSAKLPILCGELKVEASCAANERQLTGAGTSLPQGSPSSKRMFSPEMGTPRKQLKTESSESPLGCSRLQQLSLRTPQGKRLFKDPPFE